MLSWSITIHENKGKSATSLLHYVSIFLFSEVNEIQEGIFTVEYYDGLANTTKTMVATQFQSTNARQGQYKYIYM